MANALTTKEVINWFQTFKFKGLFCPDCLTKLTLQEEGVFYCPNEKCLNEKEYNKKGEEIGNQIKRTKARTRIQRIYFILVTILTLFAISTYTC